MNSKELEYLTSNGLINDLSIRFGVLGAGQKGNKDADIFAGYTFSNGTPCYPSLAVNFAEADMLHLRNIPKEDRVHFEGMKGAARTPSLVVELFDSEINEKADLYRDTLIQAMERKFSDVDHLLICLGAGGGVGTGWGSLTLNLIKDEFFPMPITMLISMPFDDPDEIANALILLDEIKEFMALQDQVFEPGAQKPLASVILVDNKKLFTDFSQKKNSRSNQDKNISWKDEGNHAVASMIHEANLIPANFGSDNVTYDPSDFTKLVQLSGKFLTISKARLEPDFTINALKSHLKGSIEKGYFACSHKYKTATMYGGFVLRPSNATFFKDVETEKAIKDVISEFNPITQMRGKFGDPIWDENYAVIYTLFAGLAMPDRFAELAEELKEIRDQEEKRKAEMEAAQQVDISAALKNVQSSTFNPYQQKKKGFGTGGFSGVKSAFSRKEVAASTEELASQNEERKEAPRNAFGKSNTSAFSALRDPNKFKK